MQANLRRSFLSYHEMDLDTPHVLPAYALDVGRAAEGIHIFIRVTILDATGLLDGMSLLYRTRSFGWEWQHR